MDATDVGRILILWAFPALFALWCVWRIARVARGIRSARDARAAMSPEEVAADLERRRRELPRNALMLALVLAAILVYEYWLGDLGWWLGRR